MRSPQLDDFTRESLPLLKSYPILHKLFQNTGEIASGWEEGGVGVTANVFFLGWQKCSEIRWWVMVAMAPHSSTLAWKIPWMEEPDRLQSMGSLRVGHNWATSLSLFTFMHWRRKWQPTPVFLLGESQGRGGGLVGCRQWGRTVRHNWSDLAAAAAWLQYCIYWRPHMLWKGEFSVMWIISQFLKSKSLIKVRDTIKFSWLKELVNYSIQSVCPEQTFAP